MKTAIWLYLFMFVAFFDLHAQYPILSPYAISLGAAPSFIGLILGVYSITHLPGNLIAGFGVDRYGSKPFIIVSLIAGGTLLLFQSRVADPWQLLVVRSISGFVLAFLSPACLAMLAKMARDHIHRSKLMSGNGFVHTMASVVSPAAGAYLVAQIGFSTAFNVLGWVLIATGFLAIFGLKEVRGPASTLPPSGKSHGTSDSGSARTSMRPSAGGRMAGRTTGRASRTGAADSLNGASRSGSGTAASGSAAASDRGIPWLFFVLPLAISCSQGILYFELPMLGHHHGGHAGAATAGAILTSGILFSLVSLGALVTLSMVFLNRFSPLLRTVCGCVLLAAVFFLMAVQSPIPLYALLFVIGMAKGVIFPAIASLLGSATHATRYGRAYSILSIAYSIGSFIGPVAAGQWREELSSYFIAFVVLMLGLSFLPLNRLTESGDSVPPASEPPAA